MPKSRLREVAENTTCPRCKAGPGDPCYGEYGALLGPYNFGPSYLHEARYVAAKDIIEEENNDEVL